MKDYEFRVKAPPEIYEAAWNACAAVYGKRGKHFLTSEGDLAFDSFLAGFWFAKRKRKPKQLKAGKA